MTASRQAPSGRLVERFTCPHAIRLRGLWRDHRPGGWRDRARFEVNQDFFAGQVFLEVARHGRGGHIDFGGLDDGFHGDGALHPVSTVDRLRYVVDDVGARPACRHLALDECQPVLEQAHGNDVALGGRFLRTQQVAEKENSQSQCESHNTAHDNLPFTSDSQADSAGSKRAGSSIDAPRAGIQ